MSITTDITLQYGQIMLINTGSVLGVISTDQKIQFGEVVSVYETSDKTAVGNRVMYDPKMGSALIYGSTNYILIDEKNTSGVEIPLP